MGISRYAFVGSIEDGKAKATSTVHEKIRRGIKNGTIQYTTTYTKEAQRLDHIAGAVYGDSSMWWILAATSGIGWGLQVPADTVVIVPINIASILTLLR